MVWRLEKFISYLYGKKVHLYTDHQALESLIKRNRINHQYSGRPTRLLGHLVHFDIAVQQVAGSILKASDILRRNPVRGVTSGYKYDEE